MINFNTGIMIDKPVHDVFTFITNPDNMPKWNSSVVSMEQITPGPVGMGTKFKNVGEMMGRHIEGEMQVVAFEPDSKYGFQMNAGPAKVNVVLTFKTVGTGTKLNLNAQGQPGGLFKLAEPVLVGRIKSMMEENLARLKSVLEKG